ncbi:D-aminoacyl-tRNA deacylase 2-like [Lineus longissimus]|uniref:D-aminoacyl-tRNA deacylase 2-like n=1 Tax=Lineus longissimus TaxID=88925 RepID=UPI002B4C39BC
MFRSFFNVLAGSTSVMSSEIAPTVRAIIQQCLHARLQVKPATEDSPAEFVEIDGGIVVYLCVLKGATSEVVAKLVKSVLGVRLSSQSEVSKLVSVLDLPGSVLIVPQATLGGKMKGKQMQYHSNIDKTEGKELYTLFAEKCIEALQESEKCQESGCEVKFGTYGNRQVLSIDTNGPYSHLIEMP